MKMIHAVIRVNKTTEVLAALKENGFTPVTKMEVRGRGRQGGLKSGEMSYDGIPKDNIYTAVKDEDESRVIEVIMQAAKVGAGTPGDGKIFVYPIDKTVTISTGQVE